MSLLVILGVWVLVIPALTVAVLLLTPLVRDWRVRRHLAIRRVDARRRPLVGARGPANSRI